MKELYSYNINDSIHRTGSQNGTVTTAKEIPFEISEVGGLRIGKDIFLPQLSPFQFVDNYVHEVGHIIGDKLSYRNGDVLTPDEIKKTAPKLPTAIILLDIDFSNQSYLPWSTERMISVAHTLLQTFCKGKFNPEWVNLHADLSREEFDKHLDVVPSGSGFKVNDNGDVVSIRSKEGRNNEISAIVVQQGCIRLLENAMRRVFPQLSIVTRNPNSLPYAHQAAHKLVARSYKYPGIVLPSALDLSEKPIFWQERTNITSC